MFVGWEGEVAAPYCQTTSAPGAGGYPLMKPYRLQLEAKCSEDGV